MDFGNRGLLRYALIGFVLLAVLAGSVVFGAQTKQLLQWRSDLGYLQTVSDTELAANRAELARVLFEAGRATADSVSDAEADLISAELSEWDTRRDASVAAYRLLHTLGTLLPVPRDLLQPPTQETT